jgi:hypothetical protein
MLHFVDRGVLGIGGRAIPLKLMQFEGKIFITLSDPKKLLLACWVF